MKEYEQVCLKINLNYTRSRYSTPIHHRQFAVSNFFLFQQDFLWNGMFKL